ncbi:MAG: hypothetical protein ABI813_00605 [Bacteroidota bacterium]
MNNDSTLLQHSLQQALQSIADRVVLVLGAGAADLHLGIMDERLLVVIKNSWRKALPQLSVAGLESLLKKELLFNGQFLWLAISLL